MGGAAWDTLWHPGFVAFAAWLLSCVSFLADICLAGWLAGATARARSQAAGRSMATTLLLLLLLRLLLLLLLLLLLPGGSG